MSLINMYGINMYLKKVLYFCSTNNWSIGLSVQTFEQLNDD